MKNRQFFHKKKKITNGRRSKLAGWKGGAKRVTTEATNLQFTERGDIPLDIRTNREKKKGAQRCKREEGGNSLPTSDSPIYEGPAVSSE